MSEDRFVLLHSPLATAEQWGGVPEEMRRRNIPCTVPETDASAMPPYMARYIAHAALEIDRLHGRGPGEGVRLVARGAAGPLAPQVAAAQRAAGRSVPAYVLLDALLPQQGTPTLSELAAAQGAGEEVLRDTGGAADPAELRDEALPIVHDWPDAPCGYLLTDARYAQCARMARLRGWPVTDLSEEPPNDAELAHALVSMSAELTA
ncbi:hypothetical protein [Allosalinactinospora lopnorensis]|uniref:hypothetical protein n=1 Tax=Allosalinactinospora lopnorensis TaxID=1352348 RepID=UPI000698FFA1|nr:hypothetical protein [Allosalinactinospora lopnorensis]